MYQQIVLDNMIEIVVYSLSFSTMDNIQCDVRTLTQQPEFKDLTVEAAIRLLGEKEKTKLSQDRDKVLAEIRSKLDDKVSSFKGSR